MTSGGDAPVDVVTGANSGIGEAATRELARRGRRVIMLCRDRERGEIARDGIAADVPGAGLELVLADLADFGAVRRAAREIRERAPRLDSLVANAGLFLHRRRITGEGFEATMAVNHLGHFLLTGLLLPKLRESGGRVVVVSSDAHRHGDLRRAPPDAILRGEGDYSGMRAYSDSKLANLLFARELARREEEAGTGVTVTALHPGMLATSIWDRNDNLLSRLMRLFKPFMGSAEKGGDAVARLAADPEQERVTGRYHDGVDPAEPSEQARDRELARRLWDASMEATGLDAFPPG